MNGRFTPDGVRRETEQFRSGEERVLVVSNETVEFGFARNRQLFLVEQGYRYRIVTAGAG